MSNAFFRSLTHNVPIKLLSFAAAFLLWLVVVNNQDPVTSVTIDNIPVQIQNESYFAEHDQYVTIESPMTISVTVSGKRSIAENVTPGDFAASIDYLSANVEEGRVPIQCSTNVRNLTISRQSASFIKLNVQNMVSKELDIVLRTEGVPAQGYLVLPDDQNIAMQPSKVVVTGPESIISELSAAEVVLNLENQSEDVSGRGKEIRFLDVKGNEFDIDESETVTASAKMMTQLMIPVYKVMDLTLELPEIFEDPYSDYYVGDVSLSITTITVYGNEEKLKTLGNITLSSISAVGETSTFTHRYNAESICRNLSLKVSGTVGLLSDPDILCTVVMSPKSTRSFYLNHSAQYRMDNEIEGYTYTFEDAADPLVIIGKSSELYAVNAADIVFVIDVSSCDLSQPTLCKVEIQCPENLMIRSYPDQVYVTMNEISLDPGSRSVDKSNE